MDTFEIRECNILCCTRCYTKIHQVAGNVTVGNQTSTTSTMTDCTKPSTGMPRVAYDSASVRTKYTIQKKAREIIDLNKVKMTRELEELSKGCSKEVRQI